MKGFCRKKHISLLFFMSMGGWSIYLLTGIVLKDRIDLNLVLNCLLHTIWYLLSLELRGQEFHSVKNTKGFDICFIQHWNSNKNYSYLYYLQAATAWRPGGIALCTSFQKGHVNLDQVSSKSPFWKQRCMEQFYLDVAMAVTPVEGSHNTLVENHEIKMAQYLLKQD